MYRGGGQASDWVVIGLDPACPEPDTELQLRAAVLLVLTWDIRKGTGIRYSTMLPENGLCLCALHCVASRVSTKLAQSRHMQLVDQTYR